jgi:hypothetical protein
MDDGIVKTDLFSGNALLVVGSKETFVIGVSEVGKVTLLDVADNVASCGDRHRGYQRNRLNERRT